MRMVRCVNCGMVFEEKLIHTHVNGGCKKDNKQSYGFEDV